MIHTIATYAMLIVGLTMLVLYFTIGDAAKGQLKPDPADATEGKVQKTFDSAMAGLLSLGSMFVAFSLSVIAIEHQLDQESGAIGEKLGGSFGRYMMFMLVVGIIVLTLAGVAMAQLAPSDTPGKDSSKARTQLVMVIVLGSVATLTALGFGIAEYQKPGRFGFDFEF